MSRVEDKQEDSFYSAVSIVNALVFYLFGVLVFLPFAKHVGYAGVEFIVSGIFLLVVVFYLVKGYPFLDTIRRIVAVEISDWWMGFKGLDDSKSPEILKAAILLVSIIEVFFVYFLVSPLLKSIHPALNGLALIMAIIVNIFFFISYKHDRKTE